MSDRERGPDLNKQAEALSKIAAGRLEPELTAWARRLMESQQVWEAKRRKRQQTVILR